VNIAYLPPAEEEKLVSFDFKQVRLKPLIPKERIIELRSVITREVFLHEALAKYIRRLVGATRPYNPEADWNHRSPSELVETCVDLGASPRATICWGRLVKVWALLMHDRAQVYPEDVQALGRYVLGHRVWLGPHAASHGVTVEKVIDDIVDRVPVP
jgi:MoxR-like ATPase